MATFRHRQMLGRELERIRKGRGLSQREVADALGWSQPTVGRVEAAKTKDVQDAVTQLLDLYEVEGDERAQLLQLAVDSPPAGWWTAYGDVLSGSYVALEDSASHIRSWQPDLVPGLLQIEEYARALLVGGAELDEPLGSVDRRVEARMLRRTLLTRGRPPRLSVVLDESVLHRQIGGPRVMRDQLHHLHQAAELPNVTVQVMSFDAGAHPGLHGRFVLLSFDDGGQDVPFVESAGGSVYLEAPGEIERMTRTWDRVTSAALSVNRSLDLLARLAKET